jgi:hypothetical protein
MLNAVKGDEPILEAQKSYDHNFDEIRKEVVALAASHHRYRELYGRTQVGASGVTPDTILQAADAVHRFVCGEKVTPRGWGGREPLRIIRSSIDDLKAFYMEARLAEDESGIENASTVNDWLWLDTRMSRLLVAARDRLIEVTDPREDPNWILARGIVPRGYGKSGYTMTHVLEES